MNSYTPSAQQRAVRDAAMGYALCCLPVLPVSPSDGKPLAPLDQATVDPKKICRWWTMWPWAMVAILAGEKSGLWGLEVGADARDALAAIELPPTHVHRTPDGDCVLLFTFDRNRPAGGAPATLPPGCTAHGEGSPVVMPPSICSTGKRYEEEANSLVFMPAPDLSALATTAAPDLAGADERQPPEPPPPGANGRADDTSAASAAGGKFWNPWRAPLPPPFPFEALPMTLQQRVLERTETTGCDASAIAMSTFASLSAMADHRITLKPKVYDAWQVRPNLWMLLVGPPSTRKTSAIDDAEYFPKKADERDAADRAARMKAAGKDADDEPPARIRVIKNATSEALVELLADQDCGTTLFTDEMTGWIGTFDKYQSGGRGAAAERAVWLLAHGGGPYSQRRISVQRVVKNLSCSILATIQPDRLKEIGKLSTDGLLQRFVPVMMRDAVAGKDVPKYLAATKDYATLLDRVGGLKSQTLMLDDAARKIYFDLEETSIVGGKANDAFGGFFAKQPRTLLVLTLLLHLCELAEGRAGVTDFVSEETTERAEHIVRECILPHARLFYDADPRLVADNQAIAAAILRHPAPTLKLRDLIHATRALRGLELDEVHRKLFPFVADEWIKPAAPYPSNTVWQINPAIRSCFAAELAAHTAEQQKIRDSILAEGRRRRRKPDAA